MKQKITLTIGIVIAILCHSNFSYTQFNQGGGLGDRFARTNNPVGINNDIRRGGMGDFTNTTGTGFGPPMATFHINSNLLTDVVNNGNNNFFLDGEVFRTDATSVNINAWRLFTGGQNAANPASEKFSVLVPAMSNSVILQARQNGSMLLNTNNTQRITIANEPYNSPFTGNIGNATKVSIHWGPAAGAGPNGGVIGANGILPPAMLNIGTGIQTTSGQRTWMHVGTFYSYDTDNMYIGMKQEAASNRNDAVIVWADDGGAGNTDNLRFIFNAPLISGSSSNSQLQNGMEVARMCPNGNSGFGNFYFFGQSTVPNRKVEILDYNSNSSSNVNLNQPQLRLTHTYNTNASLGRFTDFQTTANGDLAVLPFNSSLTPSGLQPRNVGIRTTTPRRRLDIFDDGAGSIIFGRPQLRLSQTDNATVQVYTDFQTTLQGDLFITPAVLNVAANTVTPRNTGIQTFFPQNTLEINSTLANATTVNPNNPSPSTGESGLRFTDLTSASTAFANPGTGVLSVDAEGDVVLVNDRAGFFPCNPGTATNDDDMPFDSWWEMKNHNFIFYGNGGQGNSVKIGTTLTGLPSTLTCTPLAKLEIHQKSGLPGTAGLFVSNEDLPQQMGPVYGIVSYMPSANPPTPCNDELFKVAGWFEAHGQPCWNPIIDQYALYIPNDGGTVEIGFPYNTNYPNSNFLLKVNSQALIAGSTVPSDIILKKNITPFNSGLNEIRNINPINYNYNGKAGFDSTKTYIGLSAEAVAGTAPYAVDTFYAKLDSTDTQPTALLAVNNEAIMYTTINAVKELDDIVTNMANLLAPNTPTPASPVNNSIGLMLQSIELFWLKADHASSYFGEIASDASFNKVIDKFSSSDTSAMINVHDYNTTYYWRVAAVNMTGKSPYSQTFSFTTQPIPGTPILHAPANNSTNISLTKTFVWSNGIAIADNLIEIALDSNFKFLVTQYNTKDSTINITLKEYNTEYYWRVTAFLFDYKSVVSQKFKFTTEMLPGASTLITPANGATNVPLNTTFQWSIGIPVYKSIIEVALTPDFKDMVAQFGTKDSTITIVLNEFLRLYYWRVTTYVIDNNQGAVSQTFSFTTQDKTAAPPSYPSDSRYKINVAPIDSALEKVTLLNGVYFDWNRTGYPDLNFDSTRALGFIAQQVQPIVPEAVHQNDTGALSLDYARMVALLVEAVKQQQATISAQQTAISNLQSTVSTFQQNNSTDSIQSVQISAMQECIDNLPAGMGCPGAAKKANPEEKEIQKVVLESTVAAILYQNEPNPFGSSTIIRYYIPENTKEAMLVFYDEFGREVSKEALQQKGYAKVDINAEKLAAGIYTYSLVVDGKVTDTKKMVKGGK